MLKLYYQPLDRVNPLLTLDFTEKNGSDKLEVQKFVQDKAQWYIKNKLATVWKVYDGKENILGFFTTSMTAINLKDLSFQDLVVHYNTIRYPALLLGQMGIDKKYRGNGIGTMIIRFCVGLGLDVGKRVACRYLVIQTDKDHLEYYQKRSFTPSIKAKNNNEIFWMYRRLYLP